MDQTHRNRWVILFAAILTNLCIGAVYAWSVFQKPLMAMYKWTPSFLDYKKYLNECEIPTQRECAASSDFQEGVKAFMEKRKAAFEGK